MKSNILHYSLIIGSRDAIVRLEVTSHDQIPPPIINILPTNQTLPIKSMATIPCEVGGTMASSSETGNNGPLPAVKWLKNGMELEFDAAGSNGGGRINISPNGTLHFGGKCWSYFIALKTLEINADE